MRFERIALAIFSNTPPFWASIHGNTGARLDPVVSIPYQDPREFELNGDRTLRPQGVRFDGVPLQYADPAVMQDFWELIRLSNQESTAYHSDDDGYYLPIGVPNKLFQEGSLGKVPRFIQAMLATKKTVLAYEECLRVAQNSGFVPMPQGQTRGFFGSMADGTQVYMAPNYLPHLPVVYFVSRAGFVLACHRQWVTTATAKDYLNKGIGEVIGRRSWKRGKQPRKDSWLVRSYKLMLAAPNPENYRYVNLSDEDCSKGNTRFKCSVAALIAATFHGPRPSPNHVVHHKGDRCNNNLDLLEWITQHENMLLANRTPGYESSLRESTRDLKIKYKQCLSSRALRRKQKWLRKQRWYKHPKLPILINEKGDHLFDIEAGTFCKITVITYKLHSENSKVPFIKMLTWCCGRVRTFYRLAMECFTGKLLTRREQVDHIDLNRENNEKSNLRIFSALQNANNKSTTVELRQDGEMVGVYHEKGLFWKVKYSDYSTYEEKKRACIRAKYFCYYQYGGSESAAFHARMFRAQMNQANANYRQIHALRHRGRSADETPPEWIEDGVPLPVISFVDTRWTICDDANYEYDNDDEDDGGFNDSSNSSDEEKNDTNEPLQIAHIRNDFPNDNDLDVVNDNGNNGSSAENGEDHDEYNDFGNDEDGNRGERVVMLSTRQGQNPETANACAVISALNVKCHICSGYTIENRKIEHNIDFGCIRYLRILRPDPEEYTNLENSLVNSQVLRDESLIGARVANIFDDDSVRDVLEILAQARNNAGATLLFRDHVVSLIKYGNAYDLIDSVPGSRTYCIGQDEIFASIRRYALRQFVPFELQAMGEWTQASAEQDRRTFLAMVYEGLPGKIGDDHITCRIDDKNHNNDDDDDSSSNEEDFDAYMGGEKDVALDTYQRRNRSKRPRVDGGVDKDSQQARVLITSNVKRALPANDSTRLTALANGPTQRRKHGRAGDQRYQKALEMILANPKLKSWDAIKLCFVFPSEAGYASVDTEGLTRKQRVEALNRRLKP
ncbi:hypothetical protein FisN_6Hu206 [Fistulifera solaris]|uniref:HNH nuclease domain-containing protein n=1 Tax=Fistulifera solaris TaxID=1519565 RepID=A0A1Z5K1W2_FISSO|nr:hypothetical protein FisN_6Hu206 [Fistulifera solaris]|eukprot:GAX20255.1 hypothetical protein FisN_6Hu206 [Fistulifera solaris]